MASEGITPASGPEVGSKPVAAVLGMRKNGKQWKAPKAAFRPKAGAKRSWDERMNERKAMEATKAKERELKEEKETERQRRIQELKERREAKEEKERYDKLTAKMHAKRVERLKRREKRNKALKERISSQAHEVINRARGPRPFPSIMKPAPLLRSNSSPQSNNSSHSRRSSKHSNSNLSSNFFHFPNHLHHHLGHGHKHDSAAAGGGEQAQGRRRGSLIQKLNPQLHNVEEFSNNQSHQSPPVTQCSSVKQSKDMGSGRFRPSSTANPHSDAIRRRLATDEVMSKIRLLQSNTTHTTLQLDETYSVLLERLSELKLTIARYHELQALTTQLLNEFITSSEKFTAEMKGQVDTLEGFRAEMGAIQYLQRKLEMQRRMVEVYKERLEKVQVKIDKMKQMEVVWRQRASRRLRILWGFISIMVIIWLLATTTYDDESPALQLQEAIEHLKVPTETLELLELGAGEVSDYSSSAETENIIEPPKEVLSIVAENVLRDRHRTTL